MGIFGTMVDFSNVLTSQSRTLNFCRIFNSAVFNYNLVLSFLAELRNPDPAGYLIFGAIYYCIFRLLLFLFIACV